MDDLAGLAAPGLFHQADDVAGALRVFGVRPAVLLVQDVAKRVEGLLVAGWSDVQAAPAGELHPWGHEMELDPPLVGVPHPEHVPLVRLQARERQPLEGVHHLDLLPFGRRILPREGQDTGAVAPLVGRGVDQGFGTRRVAAQDLRQRIAGEHDHPSRRVAQGVAVVAVGDHLAGDQIADRPRTAALAVPEDLDQHGG